MPRQFNLAYDRMGLHEHAGGLRMRPWRQYADCGYVGMFTLAWQSSMIPVSRGSKAIMPAFPALEEILRQAEEIRTGAAEGRASSQMAIDLEKAWHACVHETTTQFPNKLDWRNVELL